MTAMIHSGTLKTIRTARKVGRPKLAKLTGITERQIARLETAAAEHSQVSDALMIRLSDALNVSTDVLSGETQACETDMIPMVSSKCTNGCCG